MGHFTAVNQRRSRYCANWSKHPFFDTLIRKRLTDKLSSLSRLLSIIMNNLSNEWQLQEAKNKLSQLVKSAVKGVPQFITVHGKQAAVILSAEDYKKLVTPSSSLSSALLMPILSANDKELFERNKDCGRDIEL